MESWLKDNFSKRKKVEILNYLHFWADLETKIYIMYTGSKTWQDKHKTEKN